MDMLFRVSDLTLTFPSPKQFYYYELEVFLLRVPMCISRTTTITPPQLLSSKARLSFPKLLLEGGKAHPAPGYPTR